jgi:hypothetical protein
VREREMIKQVYYPWIKLWQVYSLGSSYAKGPKGEPRRGKKGRTRGAEWGWSGRWRAMRMNRQTEEAYMRVYAVINDGLVFASL